MKDYLLQIRIKNAPLSRMMKVNGIETAAELSRVSLISEQTIGHYLNLKTAPIDKSGRWKDSIIKIADCLKVPPEMLFPEKHLTKALKRNVIEGEVSFEEVERLDSKAGAHYISEEIEKDVREDLHEKLEESMKKLTPREREVCVMRSEGETYAKIAAKIGRSVERVRQINAKALRRLRHRMGGGISYTPRQKESPTLPLYRALEKKKVPSIKKACKNVQCQAVQYGQSDEVAIPDDGMVGLCNFDGDKIPYQGWMEGLCQDCITAINESGVMCLDTRGGRMTRERARKANKEGGRWHHLLKND